ncbi:uncharacterized protein [Ptychodera flava]|uniref:uncharacterized protein n=1 Tax=Ptychodera flava TaxID=63121 RepID=UPI003969F219
MTTDSVHSAGGMAFEVSFDDDHERPKSAVPKRLSKLMDKKDCKRQISSESLDAKQKQAEERRKELEKCRLERIHARQEDCRKLAQQVELLLDQDAKRHGVEGTENIKAMSKKEAARVIHNVAEDFSKLGCDVKQDFKQLSK